MKKHLSFIALGLGLVLAFTSCDKSKTEDNNKSNEVKSTEVNRDLGRVDSGSLSIAYYNQDSIATQFDFYREVDSMLKAKELAFQKELERRIRSYQSFEADIQKRMENNEITGYQLDEIQQTAMRKQQQIQSYQEQQGEALQRETLQYTTALMNKIAEAGKEFSNQNSIDLLFFYQKGGQITFINNAYDVTDEFINYLNQREDEIMSGFDEELESVEEETTTGLGGL